MTTPPSKKPSRMMLPVPAGRNTLGTYPGPWICFQCERCGRWGEYKRTTLLTEFGEEIGMVELLLRFAGSKGCAAAVSDTREPTRQRKVLCEIQYRIAGMERPVARRG